MACAPSFEGKTVMYIKFSYHDFCNFVYNICILFFEDLCNKPINFLSFESNPPSVAYINQVTSHQARLVLVRVTIRGCTLLIYIQPLRPTQPPTFTGIGNDYQPRGSGVSAAWLGSKHRSGVAAAMRSTGSVTSVKTVNCFAERNF